MEQFLRGGLFVLFETLPFHYFDRLNIGSGLVQCTSLFVMEHLNSLMQFWGVKLKSNIFRKSIPHRVCSRLKPRWSNFLCMVWIAFNLVKSNLSEEQFLNTTEEDYVLSCQFKCRCVIKYLSFSWRKELNNQSWLNICCVGG